MSTEIYYFSGSGNSLAVARDLAGNLDGALVPIPPLLKKDEISPDAEMLGFVFPVHFAEFTGVPFIVQRFMDKLADLSSKYLFAVCTHAGKAGRTIENFRKMIAKNGGQLAGGFNVKMSVPYATWVKMKDALFHTGFNSEEIIQKDEEKRRALFTQWARKLEIITQYVSNRGEGVYETFGFFRKVLEALFLPLSRLMFRTHYKSLAETSKGSLRELVQLADNSFQVNDNCNACGTCVRVCPVVNIKLVDDKPVWLHHCENCLACYHWCPQDAIQGEIVRYNKKEHHPEVSLADFLKQTKEG